MKNDNKVIQTNITNKDIVIRIPRNLYLKTLKTVLKTIK